jgi:hypothetical protein
MAADRLDPYRLTPISYILPPLMRDKLAQAWGLSTLEPWWLPDAETCPPVIRSLRAFVEERTTKPRDEGALPTGQPRFESLQQPRERIEHDGQRCQQRCRGGFPQGWVSQQRERQGGRRIAQSGQRRRAMMLRELPRL